MLASLYRFRSGIALTVCLVLSIWLVKSPLNTKFAVARGVEVSLLAPIQSIISTLMAQKRMAKEVQYLRKRAAELSVENGAMEQAVRENSELRAIVNYKKTSPYELIPAEVVAAKRDGLSSTILLNVGKKNGIERNLPVITVEGLAGKIIEVYKTYSIVRLIDDPAAKTGVRFKNINLPAIMECPNGSVGRISFQKYALVNVGDTIVTSGLGGLYPKGLFVGTVQKIEENNELRKTAIVHFHSTLRTMEHLLVMKIETMWMAYPDSNIKLEVK